MTATESSTVRRNPISADCHMDSDVLPVDTFSSRAPKSFGSKLPEVRDGHGGPVWAVGDQVLGRWGPSVQRSVLERSRRGQRMLAVGYDPDQMRPSNPKFRLEDQDLNGVDAEVMFGAMRRWAYLTQLEPETASVVAAIYNEFMKEFCDAAPGRFFAMGAVPPSPVSAMVEEMAHIAELGLVGVEAPLQHAPTPLWDGSWDPLWEASVKYELPITIHMGAPNAGNGVDQGFPASAIGQCTEPLQLDTVLTSLLLGGVFERHPNLKVVLAEAGTGWIPYLINRLDYEWENVYANSQTVCSRLPSELFREHVYATFQEDAIGPQLAYLYPDNFMWGSDYPHKDGLFPDSQAIIDKTMNSIDPGLRDKLLRGNVSALYRLDRRMAVAATDVES